MGARAIRLRTSNACAAAIAGICVAIATSGCEAQRPDDERLTTSSRLDRGASIAVSADTLVAARAGGIDVLRRELDRWSFAQTLATPDDAAVTAMSTQGNRLAVFAKRSPTSTSPLGYVTVYVRASNGAWVREQELVPDLVSPTQPEEAANGAVVVLAGTRLVLGAPRYNGGDGRVFIYQRSGSTWTESQLLEPDRATTNFDLSFGSSVALDGDTLVVSEPPSSGLGRDAEPRAGRVHVYAFIAGAFALVQTLTAPRPTDLDCFGEGVALSGDWLAIAGEVSSGTGRTLRVYKRTAGVFKETWNVPGSDVAANTGLAFDGGRLAVGAPSATIGAAANAGEVRVYRRQPNDTFAPAAAWVPFDSAAGQRFGAAVGFVDGHVVAANAPAFSTTSDVYGTDL